MSDYTSLLEAARADPDNVDFTELRIAYASSPAYDPYRTPCVSYTTICELIEGNEMEAVIEQVERILDEHYLDIQAHTLATIAYEALGDQTRVEYHKRFAAGLLHSILQSGDGTSFETAFKVVDLSEEYALLLALNAEVLRQELRQHEGHFFDVLEVRFSGIGQDAIIYFNIDLISTHWKEKPPEAETFDD